MSYLRQGRFDVIAHRGGGLEAPENTDVAFEHAARLHPEIVFELDVHLTRDGEVVVIHDDMVDRTTNGQGRINDLNYKELASLDAGYRFTGDGGKTFPFRSKGARHPLFSEVLARFPTIRVSVEIKHAHPSFEDKVVKIIQNAGANDRVVLAGEIHKVLSKARKLAPQMCSGFSGREIFWTLVWLKLRMPRFAPSCGDVLQIPLDHKGIQVFSRQLLHESHRRKKHVHIWTINDEATMRHLLHEGADGIITDAPSLLLRVARELKKI